ncbi:Adenosine monophosphate-protein transferase FICD [Fusarium oxysporum f. sp. rapae]|uniref:Adenosine monophosphate-protein transferase FICD n=1 Tax=Fusarium oxysporum f. sp. rapae TaxID=485398 RepID=A0A8J5NYT2_FUSOX|nr:Adenosine monophosphate-protein transferase FICD [Fusarium oxysporum f. sp. rapae]
MVPNLGHSIRLMLSSNLRGDGSTLTIIQDDDHYEHNDDDGSDADVNNELRKHLDDFSATLEEKQSTTEIDEIVNEKLSVMVYGSNMIEAVGSSVDITSELCRDIFAGGIDADDTEISDRDPTYEAIQTDLIVNNKPNAHEDVLQTRREILQHAKAAYYIMNEVAIKGRDLSEEIILETHRLLTYKIDSPDGIPSSQYGGIYRNCPVQRGFHSFPHQATVPKAVLDLIASLKADIVAAVASGEIDPVALAAKYCHKFVNIHPFIDGNSRTSRLILNTILLKYGGCFVCFGKDVEERDEYMNIVAEGFAAEAMDMEDMEYLPDDFKPKHHKKAGHIHAEACVYVSEPVPSIRSYDEFRKELYKISKAL